MQTLSVTQSTNLDYETMSNPPDLVILIAPNVSEQMGGEGIKALQIFQQIRKIKTNTVQITHARNRKELTQKLNCSEVLYVEDTWLSILLWKSVVLRWFIDVWFSYKAVALAEKYVTDTKEARSVVLHQTEPNSPVVPRAISQKHINIFGPINGNIYYPVIFRKNEKTSTKIRRLTHFPLQFINSVLPSGIKRADLILTAGGGRTINSLLAAGCTSKIICETIDCGINDEILTRPRITHYGANLKFVHYGRLVFHKGTALIIQALVKTKFDITLDIIGSGPELNHCRQLTEELGLSHRVTFLDWFPSHADLLDSLTDYRGLVLPSIEDANGIVVQEAMALGLPCIVLIGVDRNC
jgi:glycosyltransferase involved in cell wall biosynthesis